MGLKKRQDKRRYDEHKNEVEAVAEKTEQREQGFGAGRREERRK